MPPASPALSRARIAGLVLAAALPWWAAAEPAPLQALPQLDLQAYAGTWYQVALYPNVFQRRCVSDTTATYGLTADGLVSVLNRCRNEDGRWEQVQGVARPVPGASFLAQGQLSPATLQVRFAPDWLAWLPLVWGRYWVVDRAADGRYAIVSEPDRDYLWVLSRTPTLSPADDSAIRSTLVALGFDLARLQSHAHTVPVDTTPPAR